MLDLPSRAFLPKELTYLIPHVDAIDALVVQPVWGTVYSDIHFGNVWIEIVFRVPGACCVGSGLPKRGPKRGPKTAETSFIEWGAFRESFEPRFFKITDSS